MSFVLLTGSQPEGNAEKTQKNLRKKSEKLSKTSSFLFPFTLLKEEMFHCPVKPCPVSCAQLRDISGHIGHVSKRNRKQDPLHWASLNRLRSGWCHATLNNKHGVILVFARKIPNDIQAGKEGEFGVDRWLALAFEEISQKVLKYFLLHLI